MRYNHNLADAEEEQLVTSRTVESPESPEDHHRNDEQGEDHLRNGESPR